MKKPLLWMVLFVFASRVPLFAAPADPIASLTFDAGMSDWMPQQATRDTEELQNGANSFLRLEAKAGEMSRLNSPIWKNNEQKFVEIEFRYRSNVPHSSQDVGSWVYVPFMDNKGQRIGSEALPLPTATAWSPIRKRFAVPEGATQWQVQLRLQGTGGQVDIDDVTVRYVSSLDTAQNDEEPNGTQWRQVASWSLKRDGNGASLQGTSGLPAIALAEDTKALAFVLPDEFCDRTDLIYDITAEFVPGWNAGENKNAYGLFGLGRNMHGYAPPALSVMMWNSSQFFSRLTSADNSRAQVIANADDIRIGKNYRARTIVTSNTVTSYWNRKLQGQDTMVGQFQWPKGQKFFVGTEDANTSPLDGELKNFTLRIWEPRTRVGWAGGADTGYFLGVSQPQLSLDFPDGNGLERNTTFSISDLNNKQVMQSAATSLTAKQHSLKLPSLPQGWYRIDAAIVEKNDPSQPQLKTSHSFVVLPPLAERDSADLSPFGITEEIGLQSNRYDAVVTENLMRRAAQMGVRWWRLWVQWDAIEPEPGQVQWKNLDETIAIAKRNGLEIYLCLQGGAKPWQAYGGGEKPAWGVMGPNVYAPREISDWNRYVRALGTHLKGKVQYWQIWNEPDARNGFYPYSTEKYVEVLQQSATVLREVDAKNVVGIGGFAGAFGTERRDKATHSEADAAWGLAEFFALKPQSSFELFDNHFYSVHEPGQSWEKQAQTVEELKTWLVAHNIKTRLWNSETSMYSAPGALAGTRGGWANVPYLSEKEQARRLVELHVQSLAAGIEKTFWYGVRGDIGVINSDFSPKPSLAAHTILASKLRGMRFASTLDMGTNGRAYVFESRTGTPRYLVVAWARRGNIDVRLPSGALQVADWMGNIRPLAAGQTKLQVAEEPIYIESDRPFTLTLG